MKQYMENWKGRRERGQIAQTDMDMKLYAYIRKADVKVIITMLSIRINGMPQTRPIFTVARQPETRRPQDYEWRNNNNNKKRH